jgi:hypothetical protein
MDCQPDRVSPLIEKASAGAAIGAALGLVVWLISQGGGTLNIGPFSLSGNWSDYLSTSLSLPDWLLIIGLGMLLGAGMGVIREVRARRRAERMRQVAARMGLKHTGKISEKVKQEYACLLRKSVELENYVHGTYNASPLEISDLTTSPCSDKANQGSDNSIRRTVCLLPAEGLPEFQLVPRTFSHRALSLLGIRGMSFDPRPLASPQDRSIVGQFVASWHLEPHDRSPELGKHSTDSEQCERIVRSFLTARVMESLLPFHGWSLQVRSGRLIVWRGEGFCSEEDREPLARTASNLRAVLVGAEPSSHEEMIPAQPGDSYQVQCRRILGAMLGGVFGAIAGFLGGFAVFLSFFRPISMSPSSDVSLILLFPVCLIGGLALGALSGALAGSLLSRFLSKDASFDAEHQAARPRTQIGTRKFRYVAELLPNRGPRCRVRVDE